MKDTDIMPFGKHKGEQLKDVPASYLLWFSEQDWASKFEDLLDYIEEGKEVLKSEVKDGR